jgi:hypothetical protein
LRDKFQARRRHLFAAVGRAVGELRRAQQFTLSRLFSLVEVVVVGSVRQVVSHARREAARVEGEGGGRGNTLAIHMKTGII